MSMCVHVCVYVCTYVCMYVHGGHAGAGGGQKWVLDPMEPELQVVSELGTEPTSSARAVQDGDC